MPIPEVGQKLRRYLRFTLATFHRENATAEDLCDAAVRGSRLQSKALRNGTPESVVLALQSALQSLLSGGTSDDDEGAAAAAAAAADVRLPAHDQLALASLSLDQLRRNRDRGTGGGCADRPDERLAHRLERCRTPTI